MLKLGALEPSRFGRLASYLLPLFWRQFLGASLPALHATKPS